MPFLPFFSFASQRSNSLASSAISFRFCTPPLQACVKAQHHLLLWSSDSLSVDAFPPSSFSHLPFSFCKPIMLLLHCFFFFFRVEPRLLAVCAANRSATHQRFSTSILPFDLIFLVISFITFVLFLLSHFFLRRIFMHALLPLQLIFSDPGKNYRPALLSPLPDPILVASSPAPPFQWGAPASMSFVILLFESGGAITGEPSYLISSCVSVKECARFFGERKGLRFHKFTIRATGRNVAQLSDHRRRGNKHINHIRHHPHQLTRKRLTARQVLRLLQEVFPRNFSATLHISPLTKNVKDFHRNKILTSSFTSPRVALFFLLFSFSFFNPFLLSFSQFLPFLSSLPLSSSLSHMLQKSSSCKL